MNKMRKWIAGTIAAVMVITIGIALCVQFDLFTAAESLWKGWFQQGGSTESRAGVIYSDMAEGDPEANAELEKKFKPMPTYESLTDWSQSKVSVLGYEIEVNKVHVSKKWGNRPTKMANTWPFESLGIKKDKENNLTDEYQYVDVDLTVTSLRDRVDTFGLFNTTLDLFIDDKFTPQSQAERLNNNGPIMALVGGELPADAIIEFNPGETKELTLRFVVEPEAFEKDKHLVLQFTPGSHYIKYDSKGNMIIDRNTQIKFVRINDMLTYDE